MNRLPRLISIALLIAIAPSFGAQAGDDKAARAAHRASTPAAVKPDYADLSYGPYPNNKLDLWLAKSAHPTPLVLFIHGGGFVGGDKSAASPMAIRRSLESGVSFASINYRFRSEVPIQTVLRDCARAVQFLRWKAKEFNLDKSRVAAMGGSAGAGTSLWLAFHDDLADRQNPDPVLRESTRLVAAGANATQATYDILQWEDILGPHALDYSKESDLAAFYGLKTTAELSSPAGAKIRADVDMLGLITKDDPPVFLVSSSSHDILRGIGDVYHSSKHAIAVKRRCDEVGVPAVLKITGDNAGGNAADDNPIEFLLQHLGVGAR